MNNSSRRGRREKRDEMRAFYASRIKIIYGGQKTAATANAANTARNLFPRDRIRVRATGAAAIY